MVTTPSGAIRINAFGVRFAGGGPCGACPKTLGSRYTDKSIPPPAIALTRRNERRPIVFELTVLEIVAVAMSASYRPDPSPLATASAARAGRAAASDAAL